MKAIISGNGSSLLNMDYKRLPTDVDIFRCNQFYLEDKYYLGKQVKYFFYNPVLMNEQHYTANKLRANGDYYIEHEVLSNFKYLNSETNN